MKGTAALVGMFACIVCSVGAVAKDAVAQTAAVPANALPGVEKFFMRAQYSKIALSPDGKVLAALVPLNERQNLALVDLEKGTAVALTSFTDQDVSSYRWIGDRVIEMKTADLDEAGGYAQIRRHLLIDVANKVVLRDLMTIARFGSVGIVDVLDRSGEDLIIETRDRNVYGLDAFRYNARTGEKRLLTFESPGDVSRFVADHAGHVRIALSIPKGGRRSILSYRRSNDDKWVTLRDDPFEEESLDPIAFDFDNKTLYVRVPGKDNGGRKDVYAFDAETNQLGARIFESKGVDAGGVVFDWVGKKAIGVSDGSRDGVAWIAPEWKSLQQSVDLALPHMRNQLGWGRYDPSRVIVISESETQPPIFYLLDRKTSKMEQVAAAYPWKEGDLSPRRFVRYTARDGLSIPAYLTMPKRPDGGKPPLIVDIHGGPFVPTAGFGYSPAAQFFASRGYAVLQPDFRGTQGYGDAFVKAGWKQWGLTMQDDITDGVKWLIDSGKVDADRVCLFGGSYGGYATLWGLEKEPQMFRCGVAFVAVSDLEMMFDVTWSDFMKHERGNNSTNYFTRTLGDPDRDREKMRAVSPIYHADRIQAPLLLAYGGLDQRVPLVHGNRMRSALDKYNKPYEWVVYAEEGHGFRKDENKFDFFRRVDVFLAKNLAPRNVAASTSSASGPAVSATSSAPR